MSFPMMGLLPFNPYAAPSPVAELPPARVRAALDFLTALSVKTMTRAAGNSVEIREIAGQPLTEEELSAQATAFNLLSSYFAGRLAPDPWERPGLEGLPTNSQVGSIINCPVCMMGTARADCTLCRGRGQVIVYPTVGE